MDFQTHRAKKVIKHSRRMRKHCAAAGGGAGVSAALPQTAYNYVSHSPFANVRKTVSQENARLMNQCGVNCTEQDFKRIDQQMAKLEVADNLVAISQNCKLTTAQAMQLGAAAGAGSNAAVQYATTGKVDPVGVVVGAGTGALGAGAVNVAKAGTESVKLIHGIGLSAAWASMQLGRR